MRYNQLTRPWQWSKATCPLGHIIRRRFMILSLLALYLALSSVSLLMPAASVALADGGAPNLAYVAGGTQGVSVINIAREQVTKTISLGGDPAMAYLSLNGAYLYVAQPGLNKVTMLDANSNKAICSAAIAGQPSLLAFDPGVNTLYVAGNGAASIAALNASNCALKQTIQTSGPVYGMSIAVVGPGTNGGTSNQLWYSTASAVNVFTLPDNIMHIALASGPQYISIPAGATVYVTTRQGTVIAISLQSLQVTHPLLTGGDFGKMDYDAFTGEVYVPDKKHNRLDVLTPIFYGASIPAEPNHVISLSASPQSVAITEDGNLGFVALANGTVSMLDIPGKQLLKTFSVGGDPLFVITGTYPPAAAVASAQITKGLPLPMIALYLAAGIGLLLLIVIVILIMLVRRQKA